MENKTRILIFVASITLFALACSLSGGGGGNALNGDQLAMAATERAVQMTQTALANPPSQAAAPTLPGAAAVVPTAPVADAVAPTEVVAAATQAEAAPSAEKVQSGVMGALIAYDISIVGDLVSEYQYGVVEGPYQYPHPAYVRFNMVEWEGMISMVPVHSYELVYDEAPGLIADLQRDINALPGVGTDCINELPLNEFFHHCSHQEFMASPAKLNFANGSGVRFVTVYAIQDFAPVDNENLRYVFQGLTSDGQCYVAANFAILHDELPDTDEIPSEIYISTSDVAAEYFGIYADALSQAEDGYLPPLDIFDDLIESLEVIQCGVNQ